MQTSAQAVPTQTHHQSPTNRQPTGIYSPPSPGLASYSQHFQRQESWQLDGYPGLTHWISGSNDFFVVRKFSQLGARAVLLLQDDLTRLEESVSAMEKYSKGRPNGKGGTGSFRIDMKEASSGNPRDKARGLKEYYELLNLFSAIKSRPGAQKVQIQTVKRWLEGHAAAIHPYECEFIEKKGELITLVPEPKSLLRLWFEKTPLLRKWFELREHTDRVDRYPSESTPLLQRKMVRLCYFCDDSRFRAGYASKIVVGDGVDTRQLQEDGYHFRISRSFLDPVVLLHDDNKYQGSRSVGVDGGLRRGLGSSYKSMSPVK
jgi:hypothetical protein